MEYRWQRRERKLDAKRKAMRITGAGLKKVILPLLLKKAERAERAANERRRPRPCLSVHRSGLSMLIRSTR
ncbi:MAG: hypothetical protein EPO21_19120 [Chloroflexota bacterium]|nr:MAG: hypothetical protein EPO21_19120 [Chloroflexota bacterium]